MRLWLLLACWAGCAADLGFLDDEPASNTPSNRIGHKDDDDYENYQECPSGLTLSQLGYNPGPSRKLLRRKLPEVASFDTGEDDHQATPGTPSDFAAPEEESVRIFEGNGAFDTGDDDYQATPDSPSDIAQQPTAASDKSTTCMDHSLAGMFSNQILTVGLTTCTSAAHLCSSNKMMPIQGNTTAPLKCVLAVACPQTCKAPCAVTAISNEGTGRSSDTDIIVAASVGGAAALGAVVFVGVRMYQNAQQKKKAESDLGYILQTEESPEL